MPSTKMLEITLGLDRVHIFGDISKSQLFQLNDWLIEFATTEGQKIAAGQKVLFLVAIISLANHGIFAETEKHDRNRWNNLSNNYQFPTALDST